jgi:hypothetical protein
MQVGTESITLCAADCLARAIIDGTIANDLDGSTAHRKAQQAHRKHCVLAGLGLIYKVSDRPRQR